MLEILSQDYIRTARAKGAGEARVILKHALRGGLLPVVSFLGPALAGIISGSFVVETIFQIPGLGRYFVTAAFNRDYTMVIGTVIFFAVLIIAFQPDRGCAAGVPQPAVALRLTPAMLELEEVKKIATDDCGGTRRIGQQPLARRLASPAARTSSRVVGGCIVLIVALLCLIAAVRRAAAQCARPRALRQRAEPRPLVRHGHASGATFLRACSSAGASPWRSALWPRRSRCASASFTARFPVIYGGNVDAVMMRIVDIIYALPFHDLRDSAERSFQQ